MTNLPPGPGPTENPDGDENGALPPVPPVPPAPEQQPDGPAEPPVAPEPTVPAPPVPPAPDATPTVAYPPAPDATPTVAYPPVPPAPPAPPAYAPPPAYAQVPPAQVPPGQVPPYGQPPVPPQYGAPQYGGPPPASPPSGVNGLAIASIIVGGVAFIGAFIPFLNYAVWFVALVGLVLGIIALVRKGRSKGLAIAGTIVSALALILSIVLAIVYTFGFINLANQAIDEGLSSITPVPADPLPSDDPFATDEPDDGTDDGSTDVILAPFGQVVTYDDGMEISVSEPTPFTPSENAVGADQAVNLSFTVTIVNGTAADYQPFSFSTVTSGGVDASLIIDPDNGAEGLPPVDTIPAGQTVTYVEAYSVADAADITYDVAPGFEYQTARFTN